MSVVEQHNAPAPTAHIGSNVGHGSILPFPNRFRPNLQPMENGTHLAAIDLGSNSFRLEVGVLVDGHVQRLDYLKESVRLGASLEADGTLSAEAFDAPLACLKRFKERIANIEPRCVRAVATQTLREARNRDAYVTQASAALGCPIEIISGVEEARLIYMGVCRFLPVSNERRLVIDIGGRSTELIAGRGLDALELESLRMGSVGWTSQYFPQGELHKANFERAELAATVLLQSCLHRFTERGWDTVYGSSGTVGAVADVLSQAGWSATEITDDALGWLRHQLIRAQNADNLQISGLKDERKPVFAGGVAILSALFAELKLNRMAVAQGALRHGVLFDIADDNKQRGDMRLRAVAGLARRFGVNAEQATRVKAIASQLYESTAFAHSTDTSKRNSNTLEASWLLNAACDLHEVGMCINAHDRARHGAYVLENAALPGFATTDTMALSQLVLGQRGKLKRMEAQLSDANFAHLLLCLRLAVLLCHAHQSVARDAIAIEFGGTRWTIRTDATWLAQMPQTAALLSEEVAHWRKVDWNCKLL